jgi:hypothetical protein
MEKYRSSKIKMFGATSKFLHDHQEQLNSIPQFGVVLGIFDSNLNLISDQEVYRNTTSEGKTDVKHNFEEEMVLEAVNVASTLRAYASDKKMTELKIIVKVSMRKLVRMKELDLVTKCTQIYNEAKKYENELANYGLVPSEVALLKTKIDEFKTSGVTRDSSVADRKGTGINIIDLVDEQDEILEDQLDSFVNKFMTKDKLFYDGYYAARQIKEYGVRHAKKDETGTGDTNTPSTPTQPGN